MGAVHEEYERYMQWLRVQDASEDVRRIAKIVKSNLDALIPTVSNGGQRPNMLTPMLRRDLAGATDVIEGPRDAVQPPPIEWTRLRELKIGPFRGFRREEEFSLSSDIVLFQGPNGSGKSSVCEALEYALLGYVEEATAKRIDNLDDYFRNIYEGEFVPPQLFAEGGAHGVAVVPNAELLRFCIIEKNRIEGFARVAARTPAQAGLLIAALFGLDGFNTFVANFTATLTNLRLATPRKDELTLRRAALATSQQVVDGDAEALRALDEEQEAIAIAFEAGLTFTQLSDRLGLNGEQGRLQLITTALQEQVPAQSGVTVSMLGSARKTLKLKLLELERCVSQLQERAGEVSYKALYGAVRDLHAINPDSCPACATPLGQVTRDPFVRADQGLALLDDLAKLEEERDRLGRECDQLSSRIHTKIASAHATLPFESAVLGPLRDWAQQDNPQPAWVNDLLSKERWLGLLRHVQKIEAIDRENRDRLAQRVDLQAEQQRLTEVKELVDEVRIRRQLYEAQVVAAQADIDGFEAANADLIQDVAAESESRVLELRIQDGYERFVESIKLYRDGLPEGLLADLNELTREIYNSFNGDDHPDDLLASLTLPSRGGERIQVAFVGAPNQQLDALSILSEGHLRCLGLAIMLAKNIKLGLPLLVFDDAVNAIDFDHRQGIRDTLFGDARIRAKQMIITCHSNEFITQVQNGLAQGVSKLYVLRHHDGDHQPRVANGTDRHYLRRAIERLENNDERQALASSRQALENLGAKTWKSLTNRDSELGHLNIVLRGPTGEPELRSIVEGLSRSIARGIEQGRLVGDAWTQRQAALNDLLQVPWRYLNKGTHDGDGEDFEVRIVERIVGAIGRLSATFPG